MGPIANLGRMLSISYIGTILSDGKIFDNNIGDYEGGKGKCGNGAPIKFCTGTGEVVKGLEKGLEEMGEGGVGRSSLCPWILVTGRRDLNRNKN